jgi:hypothetical protein
MFEHIRLYQVVILAISSVMLFQGIKDFVKRETGQTVLKLLVRLAVWGGMAVVAIYPNVTILLAKMIGIIDNMNAVILVGFLFIFLIIFKLLSAIEKIEQNISEITRSKALEDAHADIEKIKNEMKENKAKEQESRCS